MEENGSGVGVSKRLTFGIVVFPGTNCDRDTYHAVQVLGYRPRYLWHTMKRIPRGIDCVILPGGFSYGDYLRAGAIARFSPIMEAVGEFAERGGIVLGICNGFQILLESGLIPGALALNAGLRFICEHVYIKPESLETPFTCAMEGMKPLKIPIAHVQGRYIPPPDNGFTPLFRYCDKDGEVNLKSNPNGSFENIAGVVGGKNANVGGMMPHPERASEPILGSTDGQFVFRSIERWLEWK